MNELLPLRGEMTTVENLSFGIKVSFPDCWEQDLVRCRGATSSLVWRGPSGVWDPPAFAVLELYRGQARLPAVVSDTKRFIRLNLNEPSFEPSCDPSLLRYEGVHEGVRIRFIQKFLVGSEIYLSLTCGANSDVFLSAENALLDLLKGFEWSENVMQIR